MHMRIDKTRENEFARGVDNLSTRRRLKVLADLRYGLVFRINVCAISGVGGYDFAIPDQQRQCDRLLVDVDAMNCTIALHGIPTLCDFRLILRELVPCHR
jgi:hypothetical protein